jgi:eukaryotic-like serine/threonine-protein kinase
MNECPELAVLERDGAADHVAGCASCRIVLELLTERRRAVESKDRRAECARFEMLIAARDEGTLGMSAAALLHAHLRDCRDCATLAATGAPIDDAHPASLPAVPTSAYALGHEVARGGMARILAARDLRVGRPVAIKEPLGRSSGLAARFEREARVTARLQHPGIVPIYEIGAWPDGTPFYSMRMVEGRTLRDAIRDSHTLDERLALLPSVIAAAEAVAFAHGNGIIHRDLTPNNILVGAHGDTVVIDWGLAKDLSAVDDAVATDPYRDAPESPELTSAGAVIGTAAYMPPEQARGAAVDERADVYALGAILYHLLVGERPYRSTTGDAIVREVLDGPPRSLVSLAPGAPRDLVSIVEKAMGRDPVARYANADELASELRRFQTGRFVEAHHYSRLERVRRFIHTHRAAVLAATVLLIAGSLAVVGIARARNHAEHERLAAVEANAKAQHQNATLMAEQGRQELLAGNTTRALAWLNEAYKAGDTSEELRFMLGTALQPVEAEEHTLPCEAQSVQFSADGTVAVAVCAYGISVVRTSDWKILRTINARSDGGTLSHDGKRIASKRWSMVSVFDTDTGALLFAASEHQSFIHGMLFTPDDRLLITTSNDATARIWDVASGKVIRTIAAGSGAMNVVRGAITPDGRTLLTFTADGLVREWDIATGDRKFEFKLPVQAIVGDEGGGISPDSTRLTTCGVDGNVRISDLRDGRLVYTLTAHAIAAMSCAFSRDGRRLVTTGLDGTARVWDAVNMRALSTLHVGGVSPLATFSPNGEEVATVGGSVRIWHAATGALLASIDDPFGLDSQLLFSPDGHHLVTAREPSTLVMSRDLEGSFRALALGSGRSLVGASPTGSHLAVEDTDGNVKIVDAHTLASTTTIPLALPIAWSFDGARVASMSGSDVVVVDVVQGAVLARVPAGKPDGLALDEHGRRLLIASAHSSVWDVEHQQLLLALDRHADKDSLARTGDLVVAWNDAREVELWSVSTKRMRAMFRLDRETLGSIGFDSRAERVVIAERDAASATAGAAPWVAQLHLYDTRTGMEIVHVRGQLFTTIDRSGTSMVSSGLNKQLEVRRLSDGALVSAIAPGPSFFVAGEAIAGGALISMYSLDGLTIRSAVDGRPLAVLPLSIRGPEITQDSFVVNSEETSVTNDEHTIVTFGPHPIIWHLPREERSPAEVDKIVRERVRWRVVDGHLLPVDSTLHGRVLRHGRPVSGATISFEGGQLASRLTVTSNADGRYEIRALRRGHYGLICMAPDHDAKGMHEVTLDRDDVTMDLDLDEESTISGVVVDEQGNPVPGVHVRAGLDDSGERAVTDATGSFAIRALGVHTFDVVVLVVPDGHPTGLVSVGPKSVKVTVRTNTDHVTGVKLVVRRTEEAVARHRGAPAGGQALPREF